MTTKGSAGEADASTGIPGLDDILAGGFARERVYLLEGSPGTGKTTTAMSFLRAGAKLGEKTLYITLSETEEELRDTARVARLGPGRRRDLRTGAAGEPARRAAAAEPALFLRPGAWRDHPHDLRGRGAGAAAPRGDRQPVGDPPAGAKLAALPPPGPGAEALFRQAQRHRAAARRPDHRDPRQDGPQRRPRRRAPGGTGPGIRRGAAPRAGDQIPRPQVPRRLPRLHHPHRRAGDLSAAGLGRAQDRLRPHAPAQRRRRARRACWAAASSAARAA